MLGININILFSALFTLLGMAGSIGVVLFIGGRWTARIEENLRSMDRRFDDVDRRFNDVNQRFDDVNLRMTEGFAAVHQRIDSLETRIASLEEKVSRLDERVSHLEEKVSHLDVRMAEIPEVTIDRLMKLFQLREAVIATTTEASKNAG